MFETLIKCIQDTPITTFNRQYCASVDNINLIPMSDVLEPNEVESLEKIYEKEFKRVVNQYRTQCNVDPNDKVYRELLKLMPVVEEKFNVKLSDHLDARLWHDEEGFSFAPHTDNSDIEISAQIYLNKNSPEHCGTSYFLHGLEQHDEYVNIWTSPYKTGSGYMLLNTNTEVHAMCHPVPKGCSRTSLYLNFRRK